MGMNRAGIRELECFVAVAEELNFSRAARRLCLSQPPLSRQIRSLEERLGVKLLERNTRTVTLTSAGALFLQDARQVLMRLDGAAAAVRRAAAGEVARLRLAFVGALLDEGLVAVLQSFRTLHPHCQIHLTDLSPAAQLEALASGQVDGAFVGADPGRVKGGIATLVWKREPLLAALPEGHPLARCGKVPLSGLRNEHWVMVSREAAPAYRRQFDELCRRAGWRAHVVQESERVAAVVTMVAAGQGISLLAESFSRHLHPGVVFRPIAGPQPVLDNTFAYRPDAAPGVMADFLKLLRQRDS
jgi:LysR family transcriptional regulator, benzoate and cis,cis-muconate-responsive activator of ben and cat genes